MKLVNQNALTMALMDRDTMDKEVEVGVIGVIYVIQAIQNHTD